MSLLEDLEKLSARIEQVKNSVLTEEATKHSFVMPFFQALGYDVFDPNVVIPEFVADVGTKKGEKVDYAIMHENQPIIIVEVKKHSENLDKYSSQLYRYFGTTDVKFALLTNGIEYRFYSDMNKANRLDDSPFLIVNLAVLNKRDVKALERFAKDTLNLDLILEMANKRKYILEVKDAIAEQSSNPNDEFAKVFASALLPQGSRLTSNVLEEFKGYIKTAFSEAITDLAAKKINSIKVGLSANITDESEEDTKINDIITTEEELQGFFIVKSMLGENCPLNRIYARDTKSYFGILLDDKNYKWIARLHFNTSNKYIGIQEEYKKETKYQIEKLEDIYGFRDKILETFRKIDSKYA